MDHNPKKKKKKRLAPAYIFDSCDKNLTSMHFLCTDLLSRYNKIMLSRDITNINNIIT